MTKAKQALSETLEDNAVLKTLHVARISWQKADRTIRQRGPTLFSPPSSYLGSDPAPIDHAKGVMLNKQGVSVFLLQ
jgi:hypothetical protein